MPIIPKSRARVALVALDLLSALAAVGGTALVAAAATLRSPEFGARASMLAGVVLIGWIAGEIAILTADAELVSPTEGFFLLAGLAMAGLGLGMRRAEHSQR